MYPLVEFEPNYNKKEDLFDLSNIYFYYFILFYLKFIEVLNCIQFTAMGSLFWL